MLCACTHLGGVCGVHRGVLGGACGMRTGFFWAARAACAGVGRRVRRAQGFGRRVRRARASAPTGAGCQRWSRAGWTRPSQSRALARRPCQM
eukprot:7377780-Prymnesium_polylepis.1